MKAENLPASAAAEHCYTPSWCRCPDEPKCQLCKSGRCPVEPPHTAATTEHTYMVYDDGECDIEHPADCPTVEIMDGVWDHDCLLGRQVRYEGFDAADVAPGEYAATAWAFQSTESRTFGEWQSGIDLTPMEAKSA